MTNDEQFFYDNAGYSYDPKTETEDEGRTRCAKELAYAEERGRTLGLSFEWSVDQDIDSSDFSDEDDPWSLWVCDLRDADGSIEESLCGIDFGRGGEPWGDTYKRVVEAELADQFIAR